MTPSGRSSRERVTELIQRGPAEALAGLLGVPMPEDELPLFWHWVYLLDRPAQRELGPRRARGRGRRARAAGECSRAARSGRWRRCASACPRRAARRCSTATEKQGRSGRLTFVTSATQIVPARRARRRERQTIVYRDTAGRAVAGRAVAPGRGRPTTSGRSRSPLPAVPLLRADLQRPPHPLRPRLRP